MHMNDPITKSVSNAYMKMKAEELSAKQKKHIDKNNNNKIDSHDFKLLRKEDNEVEENWDDMLKAVNAKSGPQPSGGSGIKKGTRYGGSNQKDEPEVKPKTTPKMKKKNFTEMINTYNSKGVKSLFQSINENVEFYNFNINAHTNEIEETELLTTSYVKQLDKNQSMMIEEGMEKKVDFMDRQNRLAAAAAETAKDPERLKRMMKIPGYAAAMGLAKKTTKEDMDIAEDDTGYQDRYAVKNGKAVKHNPKRGEKDEPHHVWADGPEHAIRKHAKKTNPAMKNEEVEELDEISTKTLAAAAKSASDPESDYYYGKSHDPQKFADHAKKTKDEKSAAAVQGAADAKSHYPRDNTTQGYDKLAYRTPSRVTAAGKANKQDTKALKTKLKEEDMDINAINGVRIHTFKERFGDRGNNN